MPNEQTKSKPEGAEQPSPEGLSSSALFAELLLRYDDLKACEHRAIWGGSYEVENACREDLPRRGRALFHALEQFIEFHKANTEGLASTAGSDNTKS
jgi:hypothetical protein